MTNHSMARHSALAVAAAFMVCGALPTASAQPAAAPAPAKKATHAKAVKKPPVKVIELAPLAAATPEQIDAATRVYYGNYDCEFKQTIQIGESAKFPAYVELRHGKTDYLMKPVLSSTGAVRLEDVRGETLMVQIASKSMLLNVKTAQRLVDDCVSPKQRELIEAARIAKSAQTTPEAGLMNPTASQPVAK
jgi:hypothetical protein